jgi:hypothetical protein
MSTGVSNFFFNNFKSSQEQSLLEDLIIEAIGIYGEDIYFIPRKLNNLDPLYTADDQSSYEQAFEIVMYIKSVDGFQGDGNFMSKFGLEIRDQVVFSVAQRVFNDNVGSYTGAIRPNEGDLIYFPLSNKCFQIKFVNKFEMFYQLGKLYTWEMTCELFEYSNEVFNTGIPEIDRIQKLESTDVFDYSIKTETDNMILTEDDDYLVSEQYNLETILGTGDNDEIQHESNSFVDFSVHDPFSEGAI